MVSEGLIVLTLAVFQGIALIIVIGIFLYQMRTRQRYTPHFTIALILSLVSLLLTILDLVDDYYGDNIELPLHLYSGLFLTLGYYAIYLHYEAISSIRPPFWRHTVIFGLMMTSLVILLLKLGELFEKENLSTNLIPIDAIESVLGIVVFSFATFVVVRTHRLVRGRTTLIELIALVLLIIANSCVVVGDALWTLHDPTRETSFWLDTYDIFSTLGDIFILIGLIVFTANYLLNIEYIYRIPIPIHQVMFYNSSGLPTYARRVYAPKIGVPETFNEELISGAISAIGAIFKETLGKAARIRHLDLGEYQIFFSHVPDDEGTLVVLTSGGNFFLSKSLERFIRTIPKEYIRSLEIDMVDIERNRERLDPLLLSSFRYLELSN
ncbi:MAG: hypothetical protein ACFFDT_30710 [Candidatus Hodarchaeota archaeon]